MVDPAQPGAPRRSPRREASVPLWALVAVAAVFAVSCFSVWALVAVSRPTVPPATASAVFVIIADAATPTLDALVATLTVAAPDAATPTVPPNVNPGLINLGSYVQVVRTEGDPLKLRAGPTLNANVNYLAVPNEVLKVTNGPTIADGFTWWYLVDPTDETRNGWAVENYLAVTNGP